jgi:hypothetical protein
MGDMADLKANGNESCFSSSERGVSTGSAMAFGKRSVLLIPTGLRRRES